MQSSVQDALTEPARQQGAIPRIALDEWAADLVVSLGFPELTLHFEGLTVNLPPALQRAVAILRKAACASALLTVDEPTFGLSDYDTFLLLDLLRNVGARSSVLVVLRTHEHARSIATDVMLLAGGRIQEAASAERFFAAPRTQRRLCGARGNVEAATVGPQQRRGRANPMNAPSGSVPSSARGLVPVVQWVSGPPGGGWFSMNEAIAAHVNRTLPGFTMEVIAGGGQDNPRTVDAGGAQFGTSIDFLAAAAFKGEAPYAGAHRQLNTVGVGWSPLPFHFVHAPEAPGDLAAAIGSGRLRIAVPPRATSDELTFRRVLARCRTDYGALEASGSVFFHGSYDAIVEAFATGEVDHVFGATTLPAEAIAAMGRGPRHGRLASLPEDLIAHLSSAHGYGQGEIAVGTYPTMQDGAVRTTFMQTVFLVSSEVPEDVVHAVTRALVSPSVPLAQLHPALARYSPASAWRDLPVPLHPGAARAYREAGLMP